MPFDGQVTETNTDKLILQRARDRIAQGWCQGEREDLAGNVCIFGALTYAAPVPADQWHALELLGFVSPGGLARHVGWNDAPGRTQDEVLARFDEAIAKLETNNG